VSREILVYWFAEFVTVTALTVIMSLAIPHWWIVIPVLVLLAARVHQYRTSVRARHLDVRRQLDLLETLLPQTGRHLRCTYYVPRTTLVTRKTMLVQAVDYVPNGGGAGREFSTEKGIIGRVYRLGGMRVENFRGADEYRKKMVSDYGYTLAEMGERENSRRSYLCYPIVEGGTEKVLGLLYFDSNTQNTFTLDEGNPTVMAIRAASEAIKRTIEC
jgi:hypothetical protein